jgi:diguanylate cyclase (GGDEF)-like protein/PAS domain S-box-containing protein
MPLPTVAELSSGYYCPALKAERIMSGANNPSVDLHQIDAEADSLLSPGEAQGAPEFAASILIIDDNAGLLYSTQSFIEANGYKCHIADGGEAGLRILQRTPVDIVLLDLSMPEMDGYAVLDAMRQEGIDSDVIVISGDATFHNATRAFRDGALDFIDKPYKHGQLLSTIENTLHKRRLKNQLRDAQQKLMESENQYRFIVKNSPDIIYMVDDRGFFTFVNDRIHELLGVTPEDLIGEHYSVLVHEDDQQLAHHVFNERRTGERASSNIELRLINREHLHDVAEADEPGSVVIELCSMGMYREFDGEAPSFQGTYGVARDISDRKRAEETIRFQAYHDLLTRLPNRELFLDRLNLTLSQASRKDGMLAVLFLDMDGFKFINDTLGHVLGDSLLFQVAERLRQILRDSDTVSRIGGDEFNILIPELQHRNEAGLIAEKILEAFARPILIDGHEITISFSIGISVFPDDAESADELIKNSDMAMYHVKGRGKNNYEYFSDNMQSIYEHRHSIKQDIHRALEGHQFEAYYQPQYDIHQRRIVGVEALIRWNHPQKGLLTPDNFIPVAEEVGMIGPIGAFMLHTGCRQLRRWLDQGRTSIKLSINVSAHQLADENFDGLLRELVRHYRIPRNHLVLEITESALMQDMEQIMPRLRNLVDCGIGICIDDFGVGYSSLAYLQNLPISSIKIDRSFLNCTSTSPDKACIIKAIVAMARELKLDIIVEGVESQTQLEYLMGINCNVAQGFMLSHPLPALETERLLLS